MRKPIARLLLVVSVFLSFIITGCADGLTGGDPSEGATPLDTNANSLETSGTLEGDDALQMGVNYNGLLQFIDYDDLARTQTTWVRGFVDFFQFYEDPSLLRDDPRLQAYLTLKDNGYKTILNIKWNFRGKDFPEPDSKEMKDYKQFLHKMLQKVWRETDLIVVGNEPFIESDPGERDERLVAFYKEMAREVRDFKKGRGKGDGNGLGNRDVPIFVGAFNNLYLPAWQTEATDALFAFAESQPWIAGVDLHIHHGGTQQMLDFLDYADARIRSDQRILITEFSLVKHFRRKMGETIPAVFASKYGWDPDTKNFEYIDYTLKSTWPGSTYEVSRQEWVDFLSNSYWFENRTRYLRNAYQRFKSYEKVYVATYAMRQSFNFCCDFRRNTSPWILNGIYANRTVRPDPETGQTPFNYAWADDFLAIQNGEFDD